MSTAELIELVVDTNVLVAPSAPVWAHRIGCCRRLNSDDGGLSFPPALALEYESVLKRSIHGSGLSLADIDDFIEYFCSRARLVQIYFRWRPILPDPDDDRILEVAVLTGAPIITFNVKDFRGAERFGIRIMSPGELLGIVGENR